MQMFLYILPSFPNPKAIQTYKTLPKALRTQVLTALTSYFGLVGMVK